ncbi:TetR family transcriptional regulator [Catellatospora sp. IY07-71]|uniref:TetR/AcrR family transcriptional regulator n=1 Tax=Catellatospora sp. IY07-71 TaxID=2728827 RepID=UPI001BB41138|nr:TetR/AcrR family transcriptional regulator [Catellatospora sp. IY07-71]BCJ77074.1 TetR family transcriptional regulator [Catellatospora sp. IY07-71]
MPADAKPLRADAARNRARILTAGAQVFSERGPAASTEEVANRAGVAIGTVFRHFPTKADLLRAIMKDLLDRLLSDVDGLLRDSEPGDALFAFFTGLVAHAARQKTVVDLLAEAGSELNVPDAVGLLERSVGSLLDEAQRAGTVRRDVALPEVMALLAAVCQGAVQGGWPPDLQARTLAVVFTGLTPR